MDIKKLLSIKFYVKNKKKYKDMINYDYALNSAFCGNISEMPVSRKKGYEYSFIKNYRKYQVNKENIWGRYYKKRLDKISRKTGIDFEGNMHMGKGMIIGHWGRIVINGDVKFGNDIFLTHGVTIGRDINGKRKGVPTIGNRVCIRANSTVVGNIVVGDDVLIAPNTFVNFDVPSHSVVIGNPASIHSKENATQGHIPLLKDSYSLF